MQRIERMKSMRRMREQWEEMSARLDEDTGGVVFSQIIQGVVLGAVFAVSLGVGYIWLILAVSVMPVFPTLAYFFGRWVRNHYSIGRD